MSCYCVHTGLSLVTFCLASGSRVWRLGFVALSGSWGVCGFWGGGGRVFILVGS